MSCLKVKYQIVVLTVSAANEIVQIASMIRGNAVELLGTFYSPEADHGTANTNTPIGDISLSFNNRGIHPLNDHVFPRKNTDNRPNQFKPVPMGEELIKDSMITGWYRDLGKTAGDAFPYKVRVYLKYLTKE